MITTLLSCTLSLLMSAPAADAAPDPRAAPEPEDAPAADAAADAPGDEPPPAEEATPEKEGPAVEPEPASQLAPEVAPAGPSEPAPATDSAAVAASAADAAPPAADAPTPDAPEEKKDGPTFIPGVQAFLRGEGRINPDLGRADAADLGHVLSRIRLQARGAWGPVAVFAQVQDARTFGFEASTAANSSNTDLHQGYLELGGSRERVSGWIRAGRQEINYGTQRIIGALAWMPNARSFDALRLHGEVGKFYGDAFAAILQPKGIVSAPANDPMEPPITAPSDGAQLAALVLGGKIHEAFNAELIGLFIREDAKNDALTFDRRVGDGGAHVFGEPVTGLAYDAEAHVQFGTFNDRDHLAWAAAADVSYLHGKHKVKPGAALGYSIASGEGCSGDPSAMEACGASESKEFFNFYPTNHKFYGLIDLFGWRNMRDLEAALMLQAEGILKLKASYHFFQLNETTGRWSNAAGANVGQGWDPNNDDNNLGHEIDVLIVSKPWKPLMIQPGYGVFIPTGAGKTIAGPDAQHYIYLWLVATI